MLLDAHGRPIPSVPALPDETPGAADGAADGALTDAARQEAEERQAATDVADCRAALRVLYEQLAEAIRKRAVEVKMPIRDVFGMVGVCVSALDAFIDARAYDENGMLSVLPDSRAKFLDQHVAVMIEQVVGSIRAQEAAAAGKGPKIAVAGADALAALPKDAARAMRGEL